MAKTTWLYGNKKVLQSQTEEVINLLRVYVLFYVRIY